VLVASGCAGKEAADGGQKASAAPRALAASRGAAGGSCRKILNPFVGSMEALRRKLAAGLTYRQYRRGLEGVRGAYEAIPAQRVQLGCLLVAGGAGERALNRYVVAANEWGECLATASCEIEAVEPRLQRQWARASDLLSSAQAGL
jgi:hypothetical protein